MSNHLAAIESLAQIRGMVELLASPPSVQLAWANSERYPLEEMFLQFEDAIPAQIAGLREQRVMPEKLAAELVRHADLLRSLPVEMWEAENLEDDRGDALRSTFSGLARQVRATELSLLDPPD